MRVGQTQVDKLIFNPAGYNDNVPRPLTSPWSERNRCGAFLLSRFSYFRRRCPAEENVAIKAGVGRDVVENHCNVCHSLDYPRINAPFLDRQGWETEVNKMITAYGAPIMPADAKIIVDYLTANYGRGR